MCRQCDRRSDCRLKPRSICEIVVGWKESNDAVWIVLQDLQYSSSNSHSGSTIGRLHNQIGSRRVGKLVVIKFLVRFRHDEHGSTLAKYRSQTFARMTEQTLISENPAELFRSRVTCNFRSQFLQTSSVTARQYYSPGIALDFICKSAHGRGPCKRLSKRGRRRLNDLTRIVTSFSDSPRYFATFVSRVQGIGVTRITRFFTTSTSFASRTGRLCVSFSRLGLEQSLPEVLTRRASYDLQI